VRARAAVVACRVGERGADGTRLHPELQEWSYTGKLSRDVKGKKEKAFTNVSMLSDQLSVTVPPPHRLSIGSRLSSYILYQG
jgi:hypothetical protein